MELLTSEIIQEPNLIVGFKVLLDNDTLRVIFNSDFWLHKEAVETIEYFMSKIRDMPVSDMLVRSVTQWFKGYLSLCFQTNLASMTYIIGFIKVERQQG